MQPLIVDYQYFLNRAVPPPLVESAVSTLLEFGEDFYICFLWSSGKRHWKAAYNLFSQVVFQKDIHLTLNGATNLLYECYKHMEWIGDAKTRYRGLRQKLIECFPVDFSCKIVIFQEQGGISKVREIKEKVRQINNIGYSSIHISDTKSEVIRLSSYLLNANSFHFLNYARPSVSTFG